MHLFIQHIFIDIWVMYKIVLGATEAKFRESWNPATHRHTDTHTCATPSQIGGVEQLLEEVATISEPK